MTFISDNLLLSSMSLEDGTLIHNSDSGGCAELAMFTRVFLIKTNTKFCIMLKASSSAIAVD